jgi:hypothetical protein
MIIVIISYLYLVSKVFLIEANIAIKAQGVP